MQRAGGHPAPLLGVEINHVAAASDVVVVLGVFAQQHDIPGQRVLRQHVLEGRVAYANELALEETLKTRRAVLWSTSRNELWRKGETSGDVLELVDVRVNCEQNSLLYSVRPRGGTCHTRDAEGNTRPNCYYRTIDAVSQSLVFNRP